MKKIICTLAMCVTMTGCVSTQIVNVDPTTIEGSKADGSVTMGYATIRCMGRKNVLFRKTYFN